MKDSNRNGYFAPATTNATQIMILNLFKKLCLCPEEIYSNELILVQKFCIIDRSTPTNLSS